MGARVLVAARARVHMADRRTHSPLPLPPLLSQMKRMVVPDALRVTRLKPGRRYCLLGRISAESGWNYKELVERLEDKRKTDALEFYAKKKELAKARAEVAASVPKPAVLTDSGY